MIRLALTHEFLGLLRSTSRMLALVAFLGCGLYATVAGDRFLEDWRGRVATGEALEERTVGAARELLASGRVQPDPVNRPGLSLGLPQYQDSYAATRMARLPSPLAGIAFGTTDPTPVVLQLGRGTDPFRDQGSELENPEHGTVGELDLAFVLIYLLPLLVAILGVEIGGYERDRGLLPLLAIQGGRPSRWFLARVAVVTSVAGGAGLLLTAIAALIGGAPLGDWAVLAGITVAYAAVWGGVLALVLSFGGGTSANALGLGIAWVLVCIIGPTLAAERALGAAAGDYGLDLSVEARSERYELFETPTHELMARLYRIHPNLSELPYARAGGRNPAIDRLVYDGLFHQALVERHGARREREQTQLAALGTSLWFSPSIAASHALERVAGVGLEAASSYRDRVVGATSERMRWVLEKTWSLRQLGAQDFEALVEASPEDRIEPRGPVGKPLLILFGWALALFALATIRLRRGERA